MNTTNFIEQSPTIQQPVGPTGAPRSPDPTGANGPNEQPDAILFTSRDRLGNGWPSEDHLTTLARLALRDDNEDLRTLAAVLVSWTDRAKANRIARVALELTELVDVSSASRMSNSISIVETQEQLDSLLGKGIVGMPKEPTE